jgi:hypothetical protein
MALEAVVVHKQVLQRALVAQVLDLAQIAQQVVQVLPIAEAVVAVALVLKPAALEAQVSWSWPIQNHRNSQVVLLATWVARWYTHLPQLVI